MHGVGNLWALDSGLNRAARHEMPAEKFARLDASAARPDKPCWSPGSTGLTTSERTEFEEVGRLLANGDAPADERAMAMFSGVVRRRALRMLDEVFELLPDVRCYALDAPQEAEPPSPEPSIASAFGASFTDGEHVLDV